MGEFMGNKRPVHVEVTSEEVDGDFEKMMKKFSRKVKKAEVIQRCIDNRFYKSKSQKRNEKNLYYKRRKFVSKIKNKEK
jgi:ribosomal protein S21